MGGKGDDQQRTTFVTDYYLSMHYGICAGPVDRLIAIWVGDKIAADNGTCGLLSAPETTVLDNRALFGGNLKEGGVSGTFDWMPGDADQVMTAAHASRLSVTPATGPGFRNLAGIFFYGGGGFLWGSNSPYIKPMAATVMRVPFSGERIESPNISGASDDDWEAWKLVSGIPIDPTTTPWADTECDIFDANPAHIIYEAFTNKDWAMGNPPYTLDFASFLASAQTLYDELFGMSIIWSKQTTIEEFVQEILNHIQAVIFVHPRTGLITLKLIRFDYDRYSVPVFTEYNSTILSVKKRLWSDTINEVVVNWQNPFSEEQETVRAQNSANIAIQGGVVSDSRSYYGVRNPTLAQSLANRDLSAASAPLTILEFLANRDAWDVVVGEVVNMVSAEYGIEALYLRIDNIDYGKPGDSQIKIVATEDIFAYESAHFVDPPPATAHDPANADPQDLEFQLAFTMPYAAVRRAGGTIVDDQEFVGVIGAQSDLRGGQDTSSFEMWGYPSSGGSVLERLATRGLVSRATLGTALLPEAETIYSANDFVDATNGVGFVVGGFIYFEGELEGTSEIAQITAVAGTDYTLKRGVLDTVPQTLPAGTAAWALGSSSAIYDPVRRNDGETLQYHLLAITSKGIFTPEGAAFDLDYVVTGRGHWPTRPANVELDGDPGPFVDLQSSFAGNLTWSRRNRLTETGGTVLAWNDADVSPEAGQTTRIHILDASDRSTITTISAISGTSHDLDIGDFGAADVAIIRVVAVNTDGDESLSGYEMIAQLAPVTSPSITGTPLLTADLNNTSTPYSFNVTATNGISAGRVFSLQGSWPAGINITQTSSTTAQIHGTATVAGTYTGLSVRVSDANGDFDDLATFTITVVDLPYISSLLSDSFVGPGQGDLFPNTDTASGTYYWVAFPSSGHSVPSIAQVLAGQDDTGSPAAHSGNVAVSGFSQTISVTGLTPLEETMFVVVQQIAGPTNSNLVYEINYALT